MQPGGHASALVDAGFRPLGSLSHRLRIEIWWHEDKRLSLLVVGLGDRSIVKACKHYYLRSASPNGETWSRDLPSFHRYLETHFPEFRLGVSFFREVSDSLAHGHVNVIDQTGEDLVDEVARLQAALNRRNRADGANSNLRGLVGRRDAMLRTHLEEEKRRSGRARDRIRSRLRRSREALGVRDALQREFARKGSALCLTFSLHSNVQVVGSGEEFDIAVRSVVRELEELDRYEVRQKLGQGRLRIEIAEAAQPEFAWIEEWLGAAFSPEQLEQLRGTLDAEDVSGLESRLAVSPDDDIVVDGHVRADGKLLGARAVSDLLERIDVSVPDAVDLDRLQAEALPAFLGLAMSGGVVSAKRCQLPLAGLGHSYVSGRSGVGKSFLGRVITEEAALAGLRVLVIDPRGQSAGLLVPEDRPDILDRYERFGMRMTEARGFSFEFRAPGQKLGAILPRDLAELGRGTSILSLKGLDETERCSLVASVLDAVFDDYSDHESSAIRLLIVVEEAQNFTAKRASPASKEAAKRAEVALDRIVREGRKYGVFACICSQTIRDFSHDSAAIRQNTASKFFLANSDRELDYVKEYVDDARELVHLRPAMVLHHNAAWGSVKFLVRPPLSKVWEPGTEELRKFLDPGAQHRTVVSGDARRLLELLENHVAAPGLNLTEVGEALGVTSKRRLNAIVAELESASLVRTRRLRERGQPRVVQLAIPSERADESADATGRKDSPDCWRTESGGASCGPSGDSG